MNIKKQIKKYFLKGGLYFTNNGYEEQITSQTDLVGLLCSDKTNDYSYIISDNKLILIFE